MHISPVLILAVLSASPAPTFKTLAPGVEYAVFEFVPNPEVGDGRLHVVRLDRNARLKTVLSSAEGVSNRTAGQWADGLGLVAAINLGMFETDYRSNVGYCRAGTHENNPIWNKYQSVLVFGPRRNGLPQFDLLDLDSPGARERASDYENAIQNLRLIKGGGVNVWKPSARKWSEAAVALDGRGRLLFLHTRTPLTMHDFNGRLLKLPLGIIRAMHVEGGPEASMSIRTAEVSLDLSGSYETGFNEDDRNPGQWPIPNVVGVLP